MKFIFDYYSLINEQDLDRWHDEFFWPMPAHLMTEISKEVESGFKQVIRDADTAFKKQTLLVGHRIPTFYTCLLQHLFFCKELKEYDIVYSEQCFYMNAIQQKKLDGLHPGHEFTLTDHRSTVLPRITQKAKTKLKEVWENYRRGRFFQGKTNDYLYSIAYPYSVLDRPYTQRIKDYIFLNPSLSFFSSGENSIYQKMSGRLAATLLEMFIKKAELYQVKVDPWLQSSLLKAIEEHLIKCASLLGQCLTYYAKKPKLHLLAPPAGKQLIRAQSIAIRERGGKVTGFNHGDSPVPIKKHFYPLFDLSTCDEYVVYSDAAKKHVEEIMDAYSPPVKPFPTIISEKNDIFNKIWESKKNETAPESIKKVMIVDHGILPDKPCWYFMHDMVYVHLLFNIIKVLKDCGVEVIYKRHPDILSRRYDDLFSRFCEQTFQPFEEVMGDTDAYIFCCAKSSIFHHAICTQKPIIYFDHGLDDFFPDVLKLLKKRCHFVPTTFDQRNRTVFNDQHLKKIITGKHTTPNHEYMQEQLFSKKTFLES